MSSSTLNRAHSDSPEIELERLIPGQTTYSGAKKPPQSVSTRIAGNVTEIAANHVPRIPEPLALLVPRPLQSRSAVPWLRSVLTDFALIATNWLLLGAVLVPLREAFPEIRTFAFASGTPFYLLGLALLHASLITLVGYTEGLYKPNSEPRNVIFILGKSVLWGTTILSLAYGLLHAIWTICALIVGAGALHFVALSAWRWRSARLDRNGNRTDVRNVLVVGANTIGRRIAAYLEKHPDSGRVVCGFLDNEVPPEERVLGPIVDLARIARTSFADEVILAGLRDRNLAVWVMREACRLRLDVEIVPELFGSAPTENEIEHVGDVPVVCVHAERLPALPLIIKRAVDVLGATAALILLGPLMIVVGALIKLDSRGSVLYSAQRAGRKGRLFRCYKFRSMCTNADVVKDALRQNNQRSGPFFKIADDPRVTRVGHFLRRYSLDELPQLFNVLKGEMSLVGPRPHPIDDVAAYDIEHLARLDVTPGITGLWQVSARRDPSFQKGMELDREYIRSWSLGTDLRILLMTVWAVVKGSGE